MDSLQASMDAESRAKIEALRIKKKLEGDINELEIALDQANKANAEAHKSIKRYQTQLRDVEQNAEDEARQKREILEKAGLADRKANALQGEMEEARALLDSAERGKRQVIKYFVFIVINHVVLDHTLALLSCQKCMTGLFKGGGSGHR